MNIPNSQSNIAQQRKEEMTWLHASAAGPLQTRTGKSSGGAWLDLHLQPPRNPRVRFNAARQHFGDMQGPSQPGCSPSLDKTRSPRRQVPTLSICARLPRIREAGEVCAGELSLQWSGRGFRGSQRVGIDAGVLRGEGMMGAARI